MIGTSFWLTTYETKLASALSTDELLRAYVEQDTDGDGLPDWQEEVYGTDPANPNSVDPNLTDKEAVAEGLVAPAFVSEEAPDPITEADIPGEEPAPNSLTKRFSEQFIKAYFAAGGGKNVSEEEQQTIINNLIESFARESENLLESSYTNISLRITSDIDDAQYIGAVEQFMVSSLPKENGDIPTLANAYIEKKDPSAQKRLGELSVIYDSIVRSLLALPVPETLADAHLTLLSAYDRVSKASLALSKYETDPIAALGALSMLVPAREDVVTAISMYATAVLKTGEPKEGEPGFLSVQFARQAEQQ